MADRYPAAAARVHSAGHGSPVTGVVAPPSPPATPRPDVAQALSDAVAALPGLRPGVVDLAVERALRGAEVAHAVLSTSPCATRRGPATLVAISSTGWSDPRARAALLAVRAEARSRGSRVVLVHERALMRSPRRLNLSLVADSAHLRVSVGDRMRIMLRCLDDPRSTLSDLAREVAADDQDPWWVVVALVAEGVLTFDLGRRTLAPSTELRLVGEAR